MSNTPNDRDKTKRKAAGTAKSRNGERSGGQNTAKGRQQLNDSNRNSILIIILSVVVVIAIVAGIVVNLGDKSSNTTPETNTAGDNVDVPVSNNDLELNKYPEVNELIMNYREAFKSGNTELLKQVYNSDQEINADILTATSQIILEYQNTQCYTKRGLNSGEYVVYVYDELKLANIETLAPNLSVFYVKPADDGTLYIYRGDYNAATGKFAYDDATQAYIQNLYQDQDVMELISTVNTKMDSACANDSDLMEFMQKVNSKTAIPAATESETESGSESESETSNETESQSETENAGGDDEAEMII